LTLLFANGLWRWRPAFFKEGMNTSYNQRNDTDSRHSIRIAVLALIGFWAVPASAQVDRDHHAVTAFVGVNVLPMNADIVLSDQTIVVSDGRIVQIGPRHQTRIPPGAAKVQGHGRYLLPGLTDMHAHLADYGNKPDIENDERVRAELILYLATGVTMVRNMAGNPAHLDERQRVDKGTLLGPRIFTATPIVDGPKPVWPAISVTLSAPEEAEDLVTSFVRAGYDQIKVYNGISLEAYAALLDSASRHHLRLVGHVPFSVGIMGALAGGQYSIEHQRGYDFDGLRPQALMEDGGRNVERFGSWQRMTEIRMKELVQATVNAGAWNCPTFVVDEYGFNPAILATILKSPAQRFLHPDTRNDMVLDDGLFSRGANEALRDSFPARYRMLKMLDSAGGGLLIGTDTPVPFLIPGGTPIDEMEHFVAAGLSTYRVLKAATIDAARFMEIDRDTGTVELGKAANLILIDGDPRENLQALWHLDGVMVAGKWLSHTAIQQKLNALANSYESVKRPGS
jgi:hypothetical protein